jgi:hypothetical protein
MSDIKDTEATSCESMEREGEVSYAYAFGYLRSKVRRLIEEELPDWYFSAGGQTFVVTPEVIHFLQKKIQEAVEEAKQEGRKHFQVHKF